MPANLWLRYFPEVPGADLDASELKKQTELRRDLAELGQLVAGTLKPSDVLASSHALHVRWHTLPERVRRWLSKGALDVWLLAALNLGACQLCKRAFFAARRLVLTISAMRPRTWSISSHEKMLAK